jgi:hypothetical protein
MASALRPWRPKIIALASDSRQIVCGGRHTRENQQEKNERGQARRGSGHAGEIEKARGRPTSEQESERGIGSRSSLACALHSPAAVGSCCLPARYRAMRPCPLPPQEQLPPLVKFREEQPPANSGRLPIGAGLQERGKQETERGIWERVAVVLSSSGADERGIRER